MDARDASEGRDAAQVFEFRRGEGDREGTRDEYCEGRQGCYRFGSGAQDSGSDEKATEAKTVRPLGAHDYTGKIGIVLEARS